MNAELKSVLTTDQSQYLCLAPSWLLLLQSDIDDEDSEDSGLPSHFFTILTIYSHLEGIGRHCAGEQLEPGLVWQRLEMESVSVESCHLVFHGYLGGAGRGDLRYSEQAEQVGNLEMNLCNRRQEYLRDFFDKYCLFSKDIIHNCNKTGINLEM